MDRRFLHGRAAAALAGVVLAATMSAGALGAPPQRISDESINVACGDSMMSGDDTAFLYGATVHAEFGAGAGFDIWANGADPSGEPTHTSNFEVQGTGSASLTGLTVEQQIAVVASGEPAGSALITATFESVGRPQRIRDLFRFGNMFERISGTFQELDITSGSMTALGHTYDLADCFAWATDATIMLSAPNAFVRSDAGFTMSCGWPADEPNRFLLAEDFGGGGFVDVFFEDILVGGSEVGVDVSPAGISTEIVLFDFNAQDEYVATLEASFEPIGGQIVENLKAQGARFKRVAQLYQVSGSLSVPDLGIELDLSDCGAEEFRTHEVLTSPNGPKGKPLANDAPDGAIAIDRGDTVRVITSATADLPEADPSCLSGDFGVEFGKSVWYSFVGDGDEITVDTAGSDFDTAIAVYEVDGDDLVEIACVDDVLTGDFTRTLQAAVSWDTDPGTTYLVQVGGWAFQSGRLVMSVD